MTVSRAAGASRIFALPHISIIARRAGRRGHQKAVMVLRYRSLAGNDKAARPLTHMGPLDTRWRAPLDVQKMVMSSVREKRERLLGLQRRMNLAIRGRAVEPGRPFAGGVCRNAPETARMAPRHLSRASGSALRGRAGDRAASWRRMALSKQRQRGGARAAPPFRAQQGSVSATRQTQGWTAS